METTTKPTTERKGNEEPTTKETREACVVIAGTIVPASQAKEYRSILW